MDSLDRYRVTLNGRSEVLVVQPQQTIIWVVPNAKTADRGVKAIDGDGAWMFPEALPDVTTGKPMDFRTSFAPYEEASMWHSASAVVSVTTILNGSSVDRMTTARGAVWIIETADGPVYEFDFGQGFPRHRRYASSQAAVVGDAHDLYVEHYSLRAIDTLKIGHSISVEAPSVNDGHPFAVDGTVATITNLFDRGTRNDIPTSVDGLKEHWNVIAEGGEQ